MTGRAIAFTEVGVASVLPMEVPEPSGDEVLIQTEASVVSPGTELRCLAGKQPDMPPFPVVPGYAGVGRVVQAGLQSSVKPGTRVFFGSSHKCSLTLLWGGHVGLAIIPSSKAFVVPDSLDPALAGTMVLTAIALRGVHVAQPQKGDKVAVVGLGPIGLLSARLHAAMGADVLALDRIPERVVAASRGGLVARETFDVREAVNSHFGQGADIVVDATGVAAALPSTMEAARSVPYGVPYERGPKLVIQGSYPGDFSLPYQAAFAKELTILLPRDARRSEREEALQLIASGAVRVDDLISIRAKPEEAGEVYRRLVEDKSVMTAAFEWV